MRRITSIIANVVAAGRSVEAGLCAHAVGDRVVCTGRVAGYAETADHLPVAVERDAAAEGDDATIDKPGTGSLRIKKGIKRVGVVQPIQGTARLCRSVEVGGREGK